MNERAGRFPLMDSMRAIAFTCVFVAHTAFVAGFVGDESQFRPFAARLDVGVPIFFLISAFLLYRPFAKARMLGMEPPATGAYAWRRLLRVAPAYWVALLAVTVWLGTQFPLSEAPLWFGFAHVYATDSIGTNAFPQAWTLCVEAAFYAFLPLYAAAMRRVGGGLRAELAGAALLVALAVAYRLWLLGRGPADDIDLIAWHSALPAWLDFFAIGIALAAISVRRPEGRVVDLLDRFPLLPWLVALAAFVLVSRGIGLDGADRPSDAQFLAKLALYAVVATGVLVPAVFGDPRRGLVRSLLGARPVLWAGMVSYGAFLYHVAVVAQLERWELGPELPSPWLWFPIGLAGSFLLAAVSWYALERPVLTLKRLVSRRPVEQGEATLEPAPAAPPEVSRT